MIAENKKSVPMIWDQLASQHRAAIKIGRKYRQQIKAGIKKELVADVFRFFCENDEQDSSGRYRLRLLPGLADVELVCSIEPKHRLPVALALAIETRLRPVPLKVKGRDNAIN